ncbi:DUF5069 domain-containing protein [Opitutaceae bacterium TAV4]|nr:DUF5069 domain-containing protein [Opitutaceae bacterium TAV4]RRK00274.1 DUF5069 domain-containing protein [Opitutaceae bacterium TAV3]
MPIIAGLRSPYHKVGRLVYFGRMIDKIRLHAAGRLPEEYWGNLGDARPGLFDARCCRFLGVSYADLKARALAADAKPETDEALLAWCHEQGARRSDEDCEVWNGFMEKRGWRDDLTTVVRQRVRESGLEGKPVATMFDYLDFDEGRDPEVSRAWNAPGAIRGVILMGVAGCGKSTVGAALAAELGGAQGTVRGEGGGEWEFWDADDFHPAVNIAKMSAGEPLSDADRVPWLEALHERLTEALASADGAAGVARGRRVVLACSALRERYRVALSAGLPGVVVVYLKGSPELLRERLEARERSEGHFMRPAMLESQLATLEEPLPGKGGVVVDASVPVPDVLVAIRHALGLG